MASLFMTIDSDSEQEQVQKNTKGKKAKPTVPKDDDIQLAHSVILQDTDYNVKAKSKHTAGHIVGSNNLWNFSESLQVDGKNIHYDDNDATTADEKAPFLQSVEERVQVKMQEKKIKLPEELTDLQAEAAGKKDAQEEEEAPKEDPTIHYDKEDLISFH